MSLLSPAAFFDQVSPRYDTELAPSYRETADDLRPLIESLAPGAMVIDLGSGTGRAWPHLLHAGARVLAIDASLPMLRHAARRNSCEHVTRVRADFCEPWPLVDGAADAIVSLHGSLAHPNGDPVRAWMSIGAEVRRVTKAGGLVAIDVPDPAWSERHLEHVEGWRYRHHGHDGSSVDVIVAEPRDVIEALGLPLVAQRCATGIRLVGRL